MKPLIEAGAKVDIPYKGELTVFHGMTALGFASLNAHPHSIQSLLQYGANIDWQDDSGRSPLHLALSRLERHRQGPNSSHIDYASQSRQQPGNPREKRLFSR